ncbi:eukaryotic translation initiation factor 2A [Conger conger]|uniref:eukaryotic translation initiation factor 2A n=1 Tax=Conger conger TaxID=82655 RepID=UPI002A5ACC24|nr:eukaryotic translation initiation factor 2A [Conger conger]
MWSHTRTVQFVDVVHSCCFTSVAPHHFRHKMAPPSPVLAVRGSNGTLLLSGPPNCNEYSSFQRDNGKSRFATFSKDGSLFGWCSGDKVNVVRVADGTTVRSLDLPKTAMLEFSPLGTVLATWQPYTKTQDNPQGEANLQLWDLNSGTCLKTFYQKKVQGWCPNWSDDERIAVRNVNNELHFFENNDFNTIANKLHLQKVSEFVLSPGPQPSKVAVYVPGSKGAPSFVRLYQYPNFGGPTSALANKSFFKSDRVTMLWNNKATAVLVTASVDVDKSGASYYGEQALHYLAVSGESAVVQLPKNGPIYDVAWSPSSTEFCVVYGFMPAKATVFNQKCDPVFDFGTGPRNAAFYSPQGHILVLAGFGNLRGQMEVWDVKKYKQVSKPQAADSTHFFWCPDGEHIVTATCSPRLRVSNGYKIWHYTGTVLHKEDTPEGAELWEVLWQPFPEGTFPAKPIKYQAAPSELGSTEAKPAQAYRPPALRNKPVTASSKLHEEEPPQNLKPGSAGDKQMSKTALKNQKKREAKKASKQETKLDAPPVQSEPASTCPAPAASTASTCGDPEIDKKIKNLKKKLKAIEQLKEQLAAGKPLEKNQVEKMQKEAQLLQELEDLELGV